MTIYRNNIYEWEGDTTQPYPNLFTWESGRMLLPYRCTFNCARVIADTGDRQDYYDSIEAKRRIISRNNSRLSAGVTWTPEIGYDIEINGDDLEDVPTVADYSGDFDLIVYIYGDDTLLFTKNIYATNKPFRVKGGVRARAWEVLITGNVRVRRFDMAASMNELKTIEAEED